MKSLLKISAFTIVLLGMVSCQNDSRPNYQFMPNMYEPVGYETYSESTVFPHGVEAMLPAEGTIPRGHVPYEIPNTPEGFAYAKDSLTSPLSVKEIDLDHAKEMYDIYCAVCHGTKGDGQGNLVKREKILGVPKYDDPGRAITQGSIYHTIYYGKNAMGSYANQLSENERWQVVAYVLKLKADLEK